MMNVPPRMTVLLISWSFMYSCIYGEVTSSTRKTSTAIFGGDQTPSDNDGSAGTTRDTTTSVTQTKSSYTDTVIPFLAVIGAFCGITTVLVLVLVSLAVYIKRLKQRLSQLEAKSSKPMDAVPDNYDRLEDVHGRSVTQTDDYLTPVESF